MESLRKSFKRKKQPELPMNVSLTEEEKRCLRLSWTTDFQQLYQIGTHIYSQLFTSIPHFARAFEASGRDMGGKDDTPFEENPDFRKQALRFIQTLDKCVALLNMGSKLDELEEFLKSLGQRHQKYFSKGSVKKEDWRKVGQVILEVMTERVGDMEEMSEEEREIALKVWENVTNYIIFKLLEGYEINATDTNGLKI